MFGKTPHAANPGESPNLCTMKEALFDECFDAVSICGEVGELFPADITKARQNRPIDFLLIFMNSHYFESFPLSLPPVDYISRSLALAIARNTKDKQRSIPRFDLTVNRIDAPWVTLRVTIIKFAARFRNKLPEERPKLLHE